MSALTLRLAPTMSYILLIYYLLHVQEEEPQYSTTQDFSTSPTPLLPPNPEYSQLVRKAHTPGTHTVHTHAHTYIPYSLELTPPLFVD